MMTTMTKRPSALALAQLLRFRSARCYFFVLALFVAIYVRFGCDDDDVVVKGFVCVCVWSVTGQLSFVIIIM